MRDKYWAMYTCIKHKASYFSHYKSLVTVLKTSVVIISILLAGSGVITWVNSHNYELLGLLLVSAGQFLALCGHLFPFNKQEILLTLLCEDLRHLLNNIDRDWDKVESLEDKEISSLIYEYDKSYDNLITRYTDDIYLPDISFLSKKVEIEVRSFFNQRYNV